jgi:hypothetical protein
MRIWNLSHIHKTCNQATAPTTLQQAQTTALLSLLNLNEPVESTKGNTPVSAKGGQAFKVPAASGPPVWKVLVLDQYTKDVLATVLRVQDLRDAGVTLHVYVNAKLFVIRRLDLAYMTDNYTPSVLHSLTSLPSISFRQRWRTSNEYQKTSKNVSTSRFI